MRCPDCNKFVSFDEPEIEEQNDEEITFNDESKSAEVCGSIIINLNCTECGTQLKSATLGFEQSFDHDCLAETAKKYQVEHPEFTTDKWTIEFESADGNDRYQSTNAKGKPIPMRYQKHFYGADVTLQATCPKCGEEITVETNVEEQASGFEEVC